MSEFLKKIRSKIVHAKIFSQRTLGYIAILNAVMLLYLTLSDLKKYGVNVNIQHWFIPILLFFAFILVFVGYLEDKFGFFEEENKAVNRRNPQMSEVLERLERIEKKLVKK